MSKKLETFLKENQPKILSISGKDPERAKMLIDLLREMFFIGYDLSGQISENDSEDVGRGNETKTSNQSS